MNIPHFAETDDGGPSAAGGALLATRGCAIQDDVVGIGERARELQAAPLQTRPHEGVVMQDPG